MLPNVSIVIPTFCEALNLVPLTEKLNTLQNHFQQWEVILVDDNSQDGTKQLVTQLQEKFSWLKLLVRYQAPDLSQAVIMGLRAAQYETLLVMDADLSHSPEYIVQMLQALTPAVDFVIGSRFAKGGSVGTEWPWFRRCNAQVAKLLAKNLINIHDPLSGFFCLPKAVFERAGNLNPVGYKIGLELMIKCQCQHVIEIPIHFHDRFAGKSKLNWKQQFNYLRHLCKLYQYKRSL